MSSIWGDRFVCQTLYRGNRYRTRIIAAGKGEPLILHVPSAIPNAVAIAASERYAKLAGFKVDQVRYKSVTDVVLDGSRGPRRARVTARLDGS
jgi:hypothetical protein